MTTPTLERASLPVPILEGPHWRVLIRPERYMPARFQSLAELTSIIERATVRWGGWDYPAGSHDSLHTLRESNALAMWVESGRHMEFWEFFLSGQFVHLLAFAEDADFDADKTVGNLIWCPKGFRPTGRVGVLSVLWMTTTVYEFASRLAATGEFGDSVVLEVGMRGISGRVLVHERSDWWPIFAAATTDTLEFSATTVDVRDLIANSKSMALDAATFFYDRFGWSGWSRDELAAEQQRLIGRVFG